MSDESDTSNSDEQNSKNHASRRDTLKAAGAFSFLGVGAFLTKSEDTVEIPIVVRDGEALDTTRVPRNWHEHILNVRRVRSNLHNSYNDQSWYDYVAQAAADTQIKELYKHQIKVYVSDLSAARDALPDQIEGIPVSVEKSREKHIDDHLSSTCDEETSTYNCVPGGAYLRNNASGSHTCWTSTCIVESSGSYYLITSAHPYGDCGDNIANESTYNGKNSPNKIGEVHSYNHDYDVAIVDQSGSINGIDNTIVGESDNVLGAVSESYCDTLISNFDPIHHMGISTGKTSGYLDEKVQATAPHCNRTSVDFLKPSTDAGAGDSGGPHYWINSEYNYIAILGPHSYHTMMSGNHFRSFCPAGYAIEDSLNWNFGATSSTC
jgi:hypothetical protein